MAARNNEAPAKSAAPEPRHEETPKAAPVGIRIIQQPKPQHTLGGLFEAVGYAGDKKVSATANTREECWKELHKKLKAAGGTGKAGDYTEPQHGQEYNKWLNDSTG